MENINSYFDELNAYANKASNPKAFRFARRWAKRIYNNLVNNTMSKGVKKSIAKQYRNSIKLIDRMESKFS